MHDTVALEKKGIPAVAVSYTTFDGAARTQARLMGLPDMKLAVIPFPTPVDPEAVKKERVDKLFEMVVKHLTVDTAPRMPAR